MLGEIVTKRIRIDDGAVLKGSVAIQAAKSVPSEPPQAKAAAAAGDAAKPSGPAPAPVPPAAPAAPESVKRAPGSSVLFKPVG
jgi:hypothetical protein